MTPQARASAIRAALKAIDEHQAALAELGFNTYVYTRHIRADQYKKGLRDTASTFDAARQTCKTVKL